MTELHFESWVGVSQTGWAGYLPGRDSSWSKGTDAWKQTVYRRKTSNSSVWSEHGLGWEMWPKGGDQEGPGPF